MLLAAWVLGSFPVGTDGLTTQGSGLSLMETDTSYSPGCQAPLSRGQTPFAALRPGSSLLGTNASHDPGCQGSAHVFQQPSLTRSSGR
jgi:hypothetical protein